MPCTPNAGNSNNARNVNTDGTLNNNNAYNGNRGVRPDLEEFATEYGEEPESREPQQRRAYPSRMGKHKIADVKASADGALTISGKEVFILHEDHTSLSDFERMADFNNLYAAYLDARKGKRWKLAVARFEVNVLENITYIHYMLTTKKYKLSPYNCFMVHEPKERLIMYNSFRDKIVQHSLCDNVLEPRLQKTFILDNYASQKGKGTHFGLGRLKKFMRDYYRHYGADGWVLKCDVKKYFYSIDHDILKSQIRRHIHDPDVLWLIDMIIDSTEGKGIPIGNHTSQWFAVLYLSGMDHFIKEQLRIKYYGRYMDDFYLIHHDKEYLKYCLSEILKYVEKLDLELNGKTSIFPLYQGIDFLGFRTYMTESGKVVQKIRRDSKNRIRRKLKKFRKLLDEGRIDFGNILASYTSWTGHAGHGNSHHLIRRMDELFYSLFSKELEGYHGKTNINVERWRRREIGQHEV